MDRDKFYKLVKRGLLAADGKSAEEQANEITNRFVYAMELEEEDKDCGVVERKPMPRPEPAEEPMTVTSPPLPPLNRDPIPQAPKKPLIILPGSKEAKEAEAKPTIAPIRISRSGNPVNTAKQREYWTTAGILEQIYSRPDLFPDKLSVIPEGSDRAIVLSKGIETSEPLKTVKVVYTYDGMERSKPSEPLAINPRLESELAPMPLDIPVFINFSAWDKDLQIEAKVEAMKELAKKVYAPRPQHIESKTPVRRGPLTFTPPNTGDRRMVAGPDSAFDETDLVPGGH